MRVYLATTNAGKRREFESLFEGTGVELATFPDYRDPVEGETSYAENAALKARSLHEQLREAGIDGHVLADDSGLEVASLDGLPGVITAYYGGAQLDWHQRRRYLLEQLAGLPDRSARYVAYLHFVAADGTEFATSGFVQGAIADGERGDAGYSFDPVFTYPPAGRTFAEMAQDEKNLVSHRAVATAKMLEAVHAFDDRRP